MIKKLFYKWFGLSDVCETCEVLRSQLDESNRERRELLNKLLTKDQAEPLPVKKEEEDVPIKSQFIPWRVRQQMLETEDAKKAELMRAKQVEIEDLEKELGLKEGS